MPKTDLGMHCSFQPTCKLGRKDSMRVTLIIATVYVALAPICSVARAAGCSSCRFRPGNSPMLADSEYFGFHPTVWQLWPGPLDPNTSYPSSSPSQSAMTSTTNPTPKTATASAPNRNAQVMKPELQSPPATVKDILEKNATKPRSTTTTAIQPQ
jgi:hypothetical protein